MPLYTYKVKNKKGEVIEDVTQSISRDDVALTLKKESLQVLSIKKLSAKSGSMFSKTLSVAEKAKFCRFLATMLRAGLSLPEALEIIREDAGNKHLEQIIFDVSYQVRRGQSISKALSKYDRDFDEVFLTMVKAGEESGSLDKSFDYLAKQLLASYELIQKVKGAMMYPIVIIAAMMANFVIMLVFVLPKLSNVFTQLNVELPPATKFVIGVGNFIGENTILSIAFVIGVIALGFLIMSIKTTRNIVVDAFMSAPLVNNIVIEIDVARFASTLSTLLRSGVPIMVSLDVASALLRLPKLRKHAKVFSSGVATGESLSDVLGRTQGVFPSTVVQTIKAGEKTGSLEEVLEEMADFYEKEVDYGLKRLTSLLEPLLMLIIGVAVGVMVIVMITPIYSLVSGMGKV